MALLLECGAFATQINKGGPGRGGKMTLNRVLTSAAVGVIIGYAFGPYVAPYVGAAVRALLSLI